MSRYVWQSKSWPNLYWDDRVLSGPLGQCRFRQGQLIGRVGGLGFDLKCEAHARILVEEAIKTSAIEGHVLNPEAVRSSVAKRLHLSSGGLARVDREAEGVVDLVVDATTNYHAPLSARRLQSWQSALFPGGYAGLKKVRVGKWRTGPIHVVSGRVGRGKIHFEGPPAAKVPAEVQKFLIGWERSCGKIDGIVRAGLAHFWFVTLHPFEDGNGRLARAISEMALAQDEGIAMRFYSLSRQIMIERKSYYDVLERCQKGSGDITDWQWWFITCLEHAIKQSEKVLELVLFKAAFWQRLAHTPLSQRQKKVLNKLLDAGPGGFEGGLTTRKYMSMARTSRATAFREIADLVNAKGLVQNEGAGRSTSYDICWT